MGTRNLTVVYVDGEYKVAQYGQWDGYPEGQGITCLHFVRDHMNEIKFRKALNHVSFYTEDERHELWTRYGARDGLMRAEDYSRMGKENPGVCRDTASAILKLIQDGKVTKVNDNIEFAKDEIFCEWIWVVDMDRRRFGTHLASEKNTDITDMAISWSFDELPDDESFVDAFKEGDG